MIAHVHDTPPPPSPFRPAALATYALIFALGLPAGFAIGRASMKDELEAARRWRPAAEGATRPAVAATAPAVATVAAPAKPAPTAATGTNDIGKLRLVGVTLAAKARKSKAWIQEEGQNFAGAYVQGDWLPGGYQLMTVAREEAIAFKGQERFTLKLGAPFASGVEGEGDPTGFTTGAWTDDRTIMKGQPRKAGESAPPGSGGSGDRLPEMDGPAQQPH